jgi:putative SOS response-associated peptidase YedK
MLTTEPGPDVAPYHGRQIAVLPQADWRAWLDYSAPAKELLRPLPGGSLDVRQAMA